jgi:AraC-like DNA-binding protein
MNRTTIVPSEAYEPLRFSTDELPERDRLAIWHEVFGRERYKVQFDVFSRERFFHSWKFWRMPGCTLASVSAAGVSGRRPRGLIGDGNDDFILVALTEGAAHMTRLGRETSVAAHEGILLNAAEVGAISVPVFARNLTFTMPRGAIASMVRNPEGALGRPIKRTGALRLLVNYAASVTDGSAIMDRQLQHTFATHVHDLVALAIGATRDGAELARNRGGRAARLAAIKADISERVGHSDLSVGQVAAVHGLTPRYVQMLFETEGMTFTEFLLARRLARAHRMLTDPRFAERSITSIAFDAGFGDLSYFDRTFRRRFGETPSDARESTRRKNGG